MANPRGRGVRLELAPGLAAGLPARVIICFRNNGPLFCAGLSLPRTNIVVGLALATLTMMARCLSRNFGKIKVYYLQDLDITEHSWGPTGRSLSFKWAHVWGPEVLRAHAVGEFKT